MTKTSITIESSGDPELDLTSSLWTIIEALGHEERWRVVNYLRDRVGQEYSAAQHEKFVKQLGEVPRGKS